MKHLRKFFTLVIVSALAIHCMQEHWPVSAGWLIFAFVVCALYE
jgi:hypothetical protein